MMYGDNTLDIRKDDEMTKRIDNHASKNYPTIWPNLFNKLQANLSSYLPAPQSFHPLTFDTSFTCLSCRSSFDLIRFLVKSRPLEHLIVSILTPMCWFHIEFRTDPVKECQPLTEQFFGPAIVAITDHLLTDINMCTRALGFCQTPFLHEITVEEAVDDILRDKPEQIWNDNYINDLYQEIGEDEGERVVLKAVHFSDVHIDLEYKEGTW